MTKIVLFFWVFTDGAITQPVPIEGWRTMEECEIAAESFTASNPVNTPDMAWNTAAMCQRVPK